MFTPRPVAVPEPAPALEPAPVPRDAGPAVAGAAVAGAVRVEGSGTGAAVLLAVALADGDAVAVLHPGAVKVLVSRDTCPFLASALPWTVVPVVAVMDVNARMLPLNLDAVPSVAELPTCQ